MNDKTLMTLGIVLAVVVVASALVYRARLPATTGDDPLALASCAEDRVSSVSVRTALGTDTATRHDGAWEVGGKEASSTRITDLLESLKSAQGEKVARNGRETPAYGFSEGATFTCVVGDTTYAYDVGATSGSGVYVARAGEGTTYLVTGTMLGSFVREPFASWAAPALATTTPKVLPIVESKVKGK